jgi:hypothetical protein
MSGNAIAQTDFPYRIVFEEMEVEGLPGMHSYAWAQHDGKWLVIGGRLDGIHARQPFASFPASANNSSIFLIDPSEQSFISTPLTPLSLSLQEQLQATNMIFTQSDKYLVLIGGYAFSPSRGNHVTFPYLTVIDVPGLMEAMEEQEPIAPFFRQIEDEVFAVNGGQLGQLNGTFILVGGHRFDGRYNPGGGPSFTQTYTESIQKFTIDFDAESLSYQNYVSIKDPVHLHRRDYNLVPQIFPGGIRGYLLSSGVFQTQVDLPFLYPVEITLDEHKPREDFNQYLSNYHGPKVGLFDGQQGLMHSLFFGGISQYYYQADQLIKDDAVPFVKTVSRVTRDAEGNYEEYRMPVEMPAFNTASAEFIMHPDVPHTSHKVLLINEMEGDQILIGHILGGIESPGLNPFTNNQTHTTSASAKIYRVLLVKDNPTALEPLDGRNPYNLVLFPNPAKDVVTLKFSMERLVPVYFMISDSSGKVHQQGPLRNVQAGSNELNIPFSHMPSGKTYLITLIFNNKFSTSKKLVKH